MRAIKWEVEAGVRKEEIAEEKRKTQMMMDMQKWNRESDDPDGDDANNVMEYENSSLDELSPDQSVAVQQEHLHHNQEVRFHHPSQYGTANTLPPIGEYEQVMNADRDSDSSGK